MQPDTPDPPLPPPARRLHGLSPASLSDVLGAPDAPPPDIPGWEIERPLGEGGLGTVWKARRRADGLVAAIKVPRAEELSLIERLESEAAALQALDHPNIVRLLECGPLDDGSLYLALEYIDGTPLSHAIPAGGLPAQRACAIFRQVLDAVSHAHSRGVVHRDLKPGNVLMHSDGLVLVADFGLAQNVHERVQHLSLTLAGLVAGTAEYLPPEAYRPGYTPAISTDIYALGVILHELLTGSPPRGAWPPVAEQKKDVDVRIDDLLRRALDPDPARRFPSADALRAELDHILQSPLRCAGTPRVTPAVRALDAAWTVLGVGICSWALVILILLIDEGPTGQRLRAYFTLVSLLVLSVPGGLWQLIRLWRFRGIPMREALPSPLGLKLGSGRLAAVLVALAQFVCVLLPAFTFHRIYRNACSDWLQPGTPSWEQGLAVTIGYRGTEGIDPWSWPEKGRAYMLRERSGWPADPLGKNIEHSTFYPGYTPRLMAGGAAFLAAVIVLTGLAAAVKWWRFRRWRSAAVTVAVGWLCLHAERAEARLHAYAESLGHKAPDDPGWVWTMHMNVATDLIRALYPASPPEWTELPAEQAAWFADAVDTGEGPPLSRDAHAARLAAAAAEARLRQRSFDPVNGHHAPVENRSAFDMARLYADTDRTTGSLTLAWMTGRMVPGRGVSVTLHRSLTHPLWTADPVSLPSSEAAAWTRACLAALATPPAAGAPDPLEPLFLPELLSPKPRYEMKPAPRIIPWTRGELITFLRSGVAKGSYLRLNGDPSPAVPMSGARQRLRLPLLSHDQPQTWTVDLIHAAGRWQCVAVDY